MISRACQKCGRPSDGRYCLLHRRDAQEAVKARWRPGRGTKAHEEIRQAVFERDGHRCVDCGSTESLEGGHIVPHVAGGLFVLENLKTQCRRCNRGQGAAMPGAPA